MTGAAPTRLRLAALVAEIEGRYTAYLRHAHTPRAAQLLTQLHTAACGLAAATDPTRPPLPPRRHRRQRAALRGAAWIIRATSRDE